MDEQRSQMDEQYLKLEATRSTTRRDDSKKDGTLFNRPLEVTERKLERTYTATRENLWQL